MKASGGIRDWKTTRAMLEAGADRIGTSASLKIVGEWKDGTQQYFDDAFALEWSGRMQALGPDGYAKLSDEVLISIARRYQAGYVVLPARRNRPLLREIYRNPHYIVCALP